MTNIEKELNEEELENILGGIPQGEITKDVLDNKKYLLKELEEQKRNFQQYKQQIVEEESTKKR